MRISSIFDLEFTPEKPWSQRRINNHRVELINNIRKILTIFAGNELTNLLRDLIMPDDMKFVATKYYNGLQRLSRPINFIKTKNKHYFFRELKLAKFTRRELLEMNYKIGKELWSSCKRTHQRLIGGRPSITEETVELVNSTMEKLSSYSSFKCVQVRKRKYKKSVYGQK